MHTNQKFYSYVFLFLFFLNIEKNKKELKFQNLDTVLILSTNFKMEVYIYL